MNSTKTLSCDTPMRNSGLGLLKLGIWHSALALLTLPHGAPRSIYLLRSRTFFPTSRIEGRDPWRRDPSVNSLSGPKMASDLSRCPNRRDRHHHCLIHMHIAPSSNI